MGVHFDWTLIQQFQADQAHILRIGKLRLGKDLYKYGDPFEFSCAVTAWDDTAYFEAACSEMRACLVRERSAIRADLRPIGIRWAMYNRIENGVAVWRKYPV